MLRFKGSVKISKDFKMLLMVSYKTVRHWDQDTQFTERQLPPSGCMQQQKNTVSIYTGTITHTSYQPGKIQSNK